MIFKEEYLFIKYRSKPIRNRREFKRLIKKSKFNDIDAEKLYTRIIKYQIKKHGKALVEWV